MYKNKILNRILNKNLLLRILIIEIMKIKCDEIFVFLKNKLKI